MTTRYKIKAVDDYLYDREELIEFLKSTDGDIVLWTKGEGFSLYRCGLIDILTELNMLDRVSVETPNYVEHLPIKYTQEPSKVSHWFQRCRDEYEMFPVTFKDCPTHRLGCFIGRKNIDRYGILYWLYNRHEALLSSQKTDWFIVNDTVTNWFPSQSDFDNWEQNHPIVSLDNVTNNEHYVGEPNNTRLSLLSFYDQFDVELVAETFVRGDTFFPTEKTVRPIIGKKPMLVYGPKNYLKHLKALGFKTWDTIWDESYDQYEGIERWNKMKPLIDQIHFWGDWEWKPRLEQAQEIADYNFDHFLNITTL